LREGPDLQAFRILGAEPARSRRASGTVFPPETAESGGAAKARVRPLQFETQL